MMQPIAVLLVLGALVSCETEKEFVYRERTHLRVTELHFDPSSEQGDVEFIEIACSAPERVDVSGWQVTGAGRLVLPPGTELERGDVLVICELPGDTFEKAFAGVKPIAMFSGKLSNKGETIRIEDPDGRVGDEVSYDEKNPEVERAAGTGLSLHREGGSGGSVRWKAATPTPGSLKRG